jgi:hypothetical protein
VSEFDGVKATPARAGAINGHDLHEPEVPDEPLVSSDTRDEEVDGPQLAASVFGFDLPRRSITLSGIEALALGVAGFHP